MPGVSPADGPLAVTGASGYIGSWIVRDCMQQGYTVHACVRDMGNATKVDHLRAMAHDRSLRGRLRLFEADLQRPGSYDAAFRGCCAVIHAGAALGHNKETPQQVYDGCFTEVRHVLDSVRRAGGTVRRFVFTSSFAAVYDPRQGYVFTEKDWCGNYPEGWKIEKDIEWKEENIPTVRDVAYAFAKARAEKLAYETAAADGSFEAMAINPLHVIGPLMCRNHDQTWSWQGRIKKIMKGTHPDFRLIWNCTDVRDVARAHRLCAERTAPSNGSRYILAARDRSGELYTWQLQKKLEEMFPMFTGMKSEAMVDGKPKERTPDRPRSYCLLAMQELGLQPYPIDDTLRATGDSYIRLGLLTPKAKM